MKELYLIGTVTGRPLNNKPSFEHARARLVDAGYRVTIPHDFIDPAWPWNTCLAHSIANMHIFDGIAVLPNSHKSTGTQIEIIAAKRMGLEIRTVIGWIEGRCGNA